DARLPQAKPESKQKTPYYMGTFPPEKMAEIPSIQGLGNFSRSKFGLVVSYLPITLGVVYCHESPKR
ncbi:MAG: hypothetical protein ABIK82_07460, partial [Pseudomonadota bacterium]